MNWEEQAKIWIDDKDKIPEEVREEIFYALYEYIDNGYTNKEVEPNVYFVECHRINAVNVLASGIFSKEGNELFGFEIEDGDWNGSVITKISEIDKFEKPQRYATVYKLEVDDSKIHGENEQDRQNKIKRARNILKRKKDWLENEPKISYDFYFDPCAKTRQYWSNWAAKLGLHIVAKTIKCDSSH